jgi:hypothetical protein
MTPAGEPSLGLLAQKLQRRQAGRSLAMTKSGWGWDLAGKPGNYKNLEARSKEGEGSVV